MKIALFYGTRPEFIKLYPLIKTIRESGQVNLTVINTGQHKELVLDLEKFFNFKPDIYMDIMTANQSLNYLLKEIIANADLFLKEYQPDAVIVQGDTTTVFGVATSAFYSQIKVLHVEAGLRSRDINSPFPEEFNRRAVSLIAYAHFCPTQIACDNLLSENPNLENVFITGNTVIDTLKEVKNLLTKPVNSIKKRILITAHRRENHGDGIRNICSAILELNKLRNDIEFHWVAHPNPNVIGPVRENLMNQKNIEISKPLSYIELLSAINQSDLIWTDSGGIQEECPEFKKPLLILRTETERPEIINCGLGVLVGTEVNLIISETLKLLDNHELYRQKQLIKNPFGDGNASKKIVEAMAKCL
jgi:UDP-N-acetylglucosamine 2-epimerase (non-hydrolysing)